MERASPKRTKIVDVKAFAPVVEVAEGGFDVEVAISQEGSARPEEVARALAELAGADLAVTGVTRLELRAERGRTPVGAPGETAMKKILISADPYETRVAIVEDNVVVETYLERATRRSLLGNVYLGRVDNVLPGMEAAFIDAGLPKNCFLYVDEIVLPELDDRERRKKKIEQLIKNGQSLLVQVVKDPMGTKGARVTMDVSLAGRFLVYSPDGKGYGVSKRLPDGERDRLRDLVKTLTPEGRRRADRPHRGARRPARGAGARPRPAREAVGVHQRGRQEEDRQGAGADPRGGRPRARDGARRPARRGRRGHHRRRGRRTSASATTSRPTRPSSCRRIKLHQAQTPLLRRYQVEDAIRSTMHRRVDLPSGGYLLFDYAEAFTIIDVNTGRFVGKSRLEDTILANNLEAAREVVRQLRLRDIGGMIVIDFIDMSPQKNRDAVIALPAGGAEEGPLQGLPDVDLAARPGRDDAPERHRRRARDHDRGLPDVQRRGPRAVQGDASRSRTCARCAGTRRSRTRRRSWSSSTREIAALHGRPRRLPPGRAGALHRQALLAGRRRRRARSSAAASRARARAAEILAEAIPVAVGQELELEIAEPHMFQAADAVAFLDGRLSHRRRRRRAVPGRAPHGAHRPRRPARGDRRRCSTAKPVTEAGDAGADRPAHRHPRAGAPPRRARRPRGPQPPAPAAPAPRRRSRRGQRRRGRDGGDRNKPRRRGGRRGRGRRRRRRDALVAQPATAPARQRLRHRGGRTTALPTARSRSRSRISTSTSSWPRRLAPTTTPTARDTALLTRTAPRRRRRSDAVDAAAASGTASPAPRPARPAARAAAPTRPRQAPRRPSRWPSRRWPRSRQHPPPMLRPTRPRPRSAPRKRRTQAEIAAAAEATAADATAPAEAARSRGAPQRRPHRAVHAAPRPRSRRRPKRPQRSPSRRCRRSRSPPDPEAEAKPKRSRGIIKRLISADDE